MKKLLINIVFLLSALMPVQAQETIGLEEISYETSNVIKLNFGPGLVYSDIYDYNFPIAIRHKTSLSLDLSVDYAHTFKSGIGFGLNFIQSHLNAIGSNELYGGASVYYACLVKNRWYIDVSLGAGYARNDYSEYKNGFGLFEQIGAHYKLTKQWGVGALLTIEGNPVGAIAGFFGLGVNFYDLSLAVTPPGVVPAGSHVQIEGMTRC